MCGAYPEIGKRISLAMRWQFNEGRVSGFGDGAYSTCPDQVDVRCRNAPICLGDMVELVMVLNVVFKFVLWSHMEMQSS